MAKIIKRYTVLKKHLLILEHTYVYARAGTMKTSGVFGRCIRLSPVFSWKRDRRSPGSVNTRRRRTVRSRIRAERQVADRRPQVDRKEDIARP